MLEVFTTGGGEYIVNVFNAVAAWTGGGGFRSLLRVVMVMGLIYALLVVAFSMNWRAWLHWFLGATLMYGALIVPTTSVKVTDRLNPSLAPATVANVPIGLAAIASVSSTAGDWLTRTAETVFVMPSSLQLSNNGMIYGARLWDKTREYTIRDPRVRANTTEYMKQCVFYDIMLGMKTFDSIANSNDILTAIGTGSPARGMRWLNASGNSSFVTCQAAYSNLRNTDLPAETAAQLTRNGQRTFPGLSAAAAKAKLEADLPVVASAFHGSSQTAAQIFQQRSLSDAFLEARANLSGADGDTFAMLRAEEQARNTYSSIAQQAMTWVPLLNIVLTVVFYAMFPVIFPLFLFPKTGVTAVKGYFTGFFYLAAWGPLYAVLHMFIMDRTADAMNAAAPGGITMAGMAGIDAVNQDTATIAGFLMMSIPFLAAGMARGAMAVSTQATSMLAPAQSAAEAAAVERTTGNYAYGNLSYQNETGNVVQRNQWNTAPSFSGGFATSSFANENGTSVRTTASGAEIYDNRGGISSFGGTASLSSFNNAERSQTLSELEEARQSLTNERAYQVSLLDRYGSRETSGVRNASGSERSSGNRFGENVQRFDNESITANDGVGQSERIDRTQGGSQVNTDHLATRRGGSADVGLGAGSGQGGSIGRRGLGASAGARANIGIEGGRTRQDLVDRGERRSESGGYDSNTARNASNGSSATQDNGSYSQDSAFSRSEGYSDSSFSRDKALEEIRRIDQRIAEIDTTATSLTSSASAREGEGSNLSFDMSQVIASRYRAKADEMGITVPSLSRTDLTGSELNAREMVMKEIIRDYYDERVQPFEDLIPDRGSVVGGVSAPPEFNERSLRSDAPRGHSGGRRNLSGGASSDGSTGERIDGGREALEARLDANTQDVARRRREFDERREGPGGADARFDQRFYDKDQRE